MLSAQIPENDRYQTQGGQQGWYKQNSGIAARIFGLFFLDKLTGWASSESGLLGTTDGGSQWSIINSLRIFEIYFADKNNGWATADTSLVRTSNGGKDWQPVPFPHSGQLRVFGMDTLYLLGGDYDFARSTDAGNTWEDKHIGGYPLSMSFVNSQIGFLGGQQLLWFGPYPPEKGTNGAGFWVTTDGGASWSQKYCSLQENFETVYALDANILIGNTSKGNIVRSVNAGIEWDTVIGTAAAFDFFFLNEKAGYIADGTGDIHFTNDSGKIWVIQNSNVTTSLNSIFFVDSLNGWVAGDNGVVLHTVDGGKSFVYQHPFYDSLIIRVFPDPVTSSAVTFQYVLPESQHISITLCDQLGHWVQTMLQNDFQEQGIHTVPITLSSNANGTYYYQLISERYKSSGKITIIR
ncbi:MAG: YCF48-related protein [Bacteroidota bacterium]|nr:YCF48-related protein [Bacteroidota bacterium]